MCKRFYTGLISVGDFLQSLFLLAIRLYWGYGFFQAGYHKLLDIPATTAFFSKLGIPFSEAVAYFVGGVESIGGILLIAGLFSRFAAIPLIIIMIVAYLTTAKEAVLQLFSNPELFVSKTPFFFLIASFLVFAFGPGKFSLDYALCKLFRKSNDSL